MSAKVESLSGSCVQPNEILDAVSGVTAKLSALQVQVNQLAASVAVQSDPHLNTRHTSNMSSSKNMCTRVPDTRGRNIWKSQVLNALKTAAGHEVSVSDAFSLGAL